MARQYIPACPCGSGLEASIRHDARGIPLGCACSTCWPTKEKRYRPEVLKDPNYYCDEAIDDNY